LLTTRGIIFRTTRFSESSLIVEVYTEAVGLCSFFMNGVYKKGSNRLPSLLQVANQIEFVSYYSESKDLHRIKEVSISKVYSRINQSLVHNAVATFILEIAKQCIKVKSKHQELYTYIEKVFIDLDEKEHLDPNFHLYFLIKFSHFFGFAPTEIASPRLNSFDLMDGVFIEFNQTNNYSVLPEYSNFISDLIQMKSIKIDIQQRRNLLQILLQYYQIHIENFKQPQSPAIFKSVFF
jgi:DNA repair protein RecO (recombination protein O)